MNKKEVEWMEGLSEQKSSAVPEEDTGLCIGVPLDIGNRVFRTENIKILMLRMKIPPLV